MVSTNCLHCLILLSDVALAISSFIVDSQGEAGPACVCRGTPLGLVACIAYAFQWGYDGKQPSIVSLETTSRSSGNQLEDDESSACLYLVQSAFLRLTQVMCRAVDEW